jgi:hypothetical protein
VGLPSTRKEFRLATDDYGRALSTYLHAVTAMNVLGLPLGLDDPPHRTPPWEADQIQVVRDLYRAVGRLIQARKAWEACRVAECGEPASERFQRHQPVRRPRQPSPVGPAAAATASRPPVSEVRQAASRYEAALDSYLTAVSRHHAAGAPLGLRSPEHSTPAWTGEQIRAVVAFRDALCQLAVARKAWQEVQEVQVLGPERQATVKADAERHRRRYREEGAPEQPY